MNKKEFAVVADAIRSYYPREKIMPTKESAELWFDALKDLDFDMAMAAVKKHTQTSKWSPTIADIRENAVSIVRPQASWSAGWEQVRLAIGRYGYMNEREALDSMDEVTRTAVKRLGWQQICATELDDLQTVRANFRMIYEQIQESLSKDAMLSAEVKEQIDAVQQKQIEAMSKSVGKMLSM